MFSALQEALEFVSVVYDLNPHFHESWEHEVGTGGYHCIVFSQSSALLLLSFAAVGAWMCSAYHSKKTLLHCRHGRANKEASITHYVPTSWKGFRETVVRGRETCRYLLMYARHAFLHCPLSLSSISLASVDRM